MLSLLLLSLICDSFLLSMFFFLYSLLLHGPENKKSCTVSVYKGPFIKIKLRADVLLLSNLW